MKRHFANHAVASSFVDFSPHIARSNDLVLINSPDVLFKTITSIPGDLDPASVSCNSPSQSSLYRFVSDVF
jgi:hypothetical protein